MLLCRGRTLITTVKRNMEFLDKDGASVCEDEEQTNAVIIGLFNLFLSFIHILQGHYYQPMRFHYWIKVYLKPFHLSPLAAPSIPGHPRTISYLASPSSSSSRLPTLFFLYTFIYLFYHPCVAILLLKFSIKYLCSA